MCEDPNIPINGSISSDGITVSYSCDVGYSVEGDRLRSCGNDSSGWRGTDPTCSKFRSVCDHGLHSRTILKNILCLFLQDCKSESNATSA